MHIAFTKMHGLGNDFIVFDAAPGMPLPNAEQFKKLAARHTGIGFDQALVIEPARCADTAAFYRIFNADGGEVEQCGNGARCVAAWLRRNGRAPVGDITLGSPGGLVRARLHNDGLVSVNMGEPDFAPSALPLNMAAAAEEYSLDIAGERIGFGAVSIGNPHAVIMVPAIADAPVARIGTALGQHAAFPKRVNVGFMEIVSPEHIRLRVFERGVGETLACGTGACAAVAVGGRRGRLGRRVRVTVPGGELSVSWQGSGEPIWLTGPAEIAFEGRAEL